MEARKRMGEGGAGRRRRRRGRHYQVVARMGSPSSGVLTDPGPSTTCRLRPPTRWKPGNKSSWARNLTPIVTRDGNYVWQGVVSRRVSLSATTQKAHRSTLLAPVAGNNVQTPNVSRDHSVSFHVRGWPCWISAYATIFCKKRGANSRGGATAMLRAPCNLANATRMVNPTRIDTMLD